MIFFIKVVSCLKRFITSYN